MEIVAHGLWAAAAAVTAKGSTNASVSVAWTVWWAAFPDVLASGPPIAAGLWVRLAGGPSSGPAAIPRVLIGLHLYPVAHSLIVFLLVFGITTILARRIVFEMLGWLMHILIDIPTHSYSYNATRFLWPISDYRVDGIAWWTPAFWAATYGALGIAYFMLWKKGWMRSARHRERELAESGRRWFRMTASANYHRCHIVIGNAPRLGTLGNVPTFTRGASWKPMIITFHRPGVPRTDVRGTLAGGWTANVRGSKRLPMIAIRKPRRWHCQPRS